MKCYVVSLPATASAVMVKFKKEDVVVEDRDGCSFDIELQSQRSVQGADKGFEITLFGIQWCVRCKNGCGATH